MENGNHSSHRTKEEENDNRRMKRNGEKGKVKSLPNVSDKTGPTSYPRGTSFKKVISSPLSTRKSERLEKRVPPIPAVKSNSETVDKKKMPSPLRRSGRTRSHPSSSPSDSNSSGSLTSKQKPKKERSVRQLTFEAKEINESAEHDLGTSQAKVKKINARVYRSFFKLQKKDLNWIDKSNQGGSNGGGKMDECSGGSYSDCKEVSENDTLPSEDAKAKEVRVDSGLSEPEKDLLENNMALCSLAPPSATSYESGLVPERNQPDCCGEETLQMLASSNSILDEDLTRKSVGHDRGEKSVLSKQKGIMVDMDSDVSAPLANVDNCNLNLDGSPSRPGGNITETDGSCSKRIRLDYNPTVSKSCNPCSTELQHGDDTDTSMLQKDSLASSLTDAAKTMCLICKCEGQLLYCGGKECSGCYHLHCLEPPLLEAPLGVWYCHFCVRKKIEFGVYSVSEGVESICDVRVSFSNVNAHKEFLVKYKGLAHVHNRWVPESQLLLEAPLMLMKFNQKYQTLQLKPEWSTPHRLLQKRALICGKHHDDHRLNHAVDNFGCCYEWLVKWRGLGYEHATWELDNASFLGTLEGQSLIRGYEERFQRAKKISSCSKLDKKTDHGNSVNKLSQMPGGISCGFSNSNLDAVNKLREHWHRGQNAIVIDDHDRILKVVAFILSLHSDTYRPFLIVSTAASICSWEDEFYQMDPSIDVVIYNGNKEIRNSIRRLEFYDEGHCILFQALVVVPEVLMEDMDVLGGIEWEAIIVDQCQSPNISSYFKQIKMLNTHLRVLLFCGQLKDNIAENINILALLDCQIHNEKDGLLCNSNNIAQLKDRLSSYIAYRCKSDSFRFVEYWVPVQISHMQLEQYCSILLSNASILRSSSKVYTTGTVRDVLISTQKCCNHPYVVDPDLQLLRHKGLEPIEHLDVDIKASGKLQLLDLMLRELRKNALRVLILFQSIGGSGRFSTGNILEDLLQQRFGFDSYERIVRGLTHSMKQSVMKKFNDKNNGRFFLLLETCACLPSIKLSSVDTIIIYDSDWNPVNDIRSLQKIQIDSQFELIKIFRLYSSFTIEEKALILAKQDKTLDVNLQNMNRITSHMLLMWGASFLFDELRIFHDGENSVSNSNLKSLLGGPLLKEVMHEFSSLLSQDGEDIDISNCSTLLKVQRNRGTYRANFSLLNEMKIRVLDEEPPQLFWTKILEGKQFQWKYLNSSSQRSRKKVHHFDGSSDGLDLVSEGIVKKRRKVSNNIVDQPSSKSEGNKLSAGIKAGTSEDLVDRSQGNDAESEQKSRSHGEQRRLHNLLKPEITKLCDVLLLPDNVKTMVDNFLEYVMNNHHVSQEPVSILQAFQLSLIWTAASLLKHKLDHKASLVLAKQHLNFDCKKEEVDYIYSMLRCLKRTFLHRTGNYNDSGSPKASKSLDRAYSCTGAQELDLFKKDMSRSIKEIQKKCEKQLKKLCLMQEEEKQRLREAIEDEKTGLERMYKVNLAVIRSCSPNDVTRMEHLKDLNIGYQKGIEELKCQHETRLKDLQDMQLAKMQKFQDREATWVEDVTSWAENELSNMISSKELWTGVESMQTFHQVQPHNGLKNHFAEVKGDDNMVEAMTETGSGVPETNSPAVVLSSSTVELQNPVVKHIGANEMGIMVSDMVTEHSHSREQNYCGDGCGNFSYGSRDGCRDDTVTFVLPSSNREMCDGETSVGATAELTHEVVKSSNPIDGQEKVHSSMQRELDETMLIASGCGFSQEVRANDSDDGKNNIACVNSQSPEKRIPGANTMCMLHCENSVQIYVADECNDSTNSVRENLPISDKRIANRATLSLLDREELLGLHGTVNTTEFPENGITVNSLSYMEQISDRDAVKECFDKELSRPNETASLSNGPDNNTFLNPRHQNSVVVSSSISDRHIPVEMPKTSNEGDTASVLERELPVETPGMVNFTNCPQNGTPLNSPSSMDQICDRSSLDVPGLDTVLSSWPCQAASSSDSLVTTSLSNPLLEQQTTDGVPLNIPVRDIPVIVPESSQTVVDDNNDIEPLTNAVLVDKGTTSDQQEGAPKTMTKLFPETPVSRSANVMDAPEHVLQLSSVESSAHHNTSGEMQNFSEQAEAVPIDVPAGQSDHVSLIMKPLEQVQQLPSAELPSSHLDSANYPLSTEIEHQPTVSNQEVVQPDSNSELDSRSGGVVLLPASNSDDDSLTLGDLSASRMLLHLCYDPLKNELDRIRKVTEQTTKNFEDVKLRLKSDFEKELEELRRKYDIKFQEIEVEFQQTKKTLDTSQYIVRMNKILADAFRSKCAVLKASGTSGMQQDSSFAQQLFQPSRQHSATWPSPVAGSSSCGPSAINLQSPSTTASSQHMLPPIQAGYVASGIFSNVSARLPTINSISSPLGNLQAGGEICAPAPHLQPYMPATSVPASSVPDLLHRMLSQTATSSVPATNPSFSHGPPRPKSTTYLHSGRWPDSAGGLFTSNLPAMDLRVSASSKSTTNGPNVGSRMSDVASVNLSRFGSSSSVQANSPHQATSPDLVCLSDDD